VALSIFSSPVLSSADAQAAGNREIRNAAWIRMTRMTTLISEIRLWALFTIAFLYVVLMLLFYALPAN
jgi:hypothetical protein